MLKKILQISSIITFLAFITLVFLQFSINFLNSDNFNNSISISSKLSSQQKLYVECINCPTLAKYYLHEILENTSQSYDMPSEFLDHKVSIEITKDSKVITQKIDKSINYEFHGLNTNDHILIYIDPTVSNLSTEEIETADIYNKFFYGLLVHEVTHSMQYNFYQQPRTAILPKWYKEGQAEYQRYKQLDLNLPQTIENQESYLNQYIDLVRTKGQQKAAYLPFYIEDGMRFEELVSNDDL